MFDRNEFVELLDLVAQKTMAMDLTWDWPCGVAFYGLTQAWEVTKDEKYITFLKDWVDEYMEIGLPVFTVNTCAMGHTLITLYQATGEQKYLDLAKRKINYLKNDALRFGDRVLQHTVSSNNDFPEQAWADTLFMAAYFMLRMGFLTDDKELVNDALNQYYWHEQYLQDEKTNLFYHGYNNINKDHMSGFYWARANAWAAVTMGEATRYINYLYPMFMQIDCALRDQLSSLVRLQTENGLWHTILDDPESYEELSASAGIAAALIMSHNPLYNKYIEKAYKGIKDNITDDGRVANVSAGTAVMLTKEDYRNVPKKRIQGWGQGLTLTFLALLVERADMGGKVRKNRIKDMN